MKKTYAVSLGKELAEAAQEQAAKEGKSFSKLIELLLAVHLLRKGADGAVLAEVWEKDHPRRRCKND
jgi:hypothetical protein